jgi:selenocysteine lyase/cysteine desulfurase
MTSLETLRSEFDRHPGYLDAASGGRGARRVVADMAANLTTWAAGTAGPATYDDAVSRARAAYARIVHAPVGAVAIGTQVSVMASLLAVAVPDGAEVLCVEGDFSSMVFPFLAHADRIVVRHVPLDRLAEEIGPRTFLVAFSLVQSATGEAADAEAVVAAARVAGALTFCDLTQAAGWTPVDATMFDATACAAYKWLTAPRGTGFLTVGEHLRDRLRPIHAGWYAGGDVWESCYGPTMALAEDARRFDVSPAWPVWIGAATALELFAGVDMSAVRRWDVDLADMFRDALGLGPGDSAIVSLPDPFGDARGRLAAAGCTVAGRAGRVRLSFHVWNDAEDVSRAVGALRP